jgi:hypothetical protein
MLIFSAFFSELSCPGTWLVRILSLAIHISPNNGAINMIQTDKLVVNVLTMHWELWIIIIGPVLVMILYHYMRGGLLGCHYSGLLLAKIRNNIKIKLIILIWSSTRDKDPFWFVNARRGAEISFFPQPLKHFADGISHTHEIAYVIKNPARNLKFLFWLDSFCYEKRLFSELCTSRRNPYLKAVD